MKNNNIKDAINSLSPPESTKQKIKANVIENRQSAPKQNLSFKLKLAVSVAACALAAVAGLALLNIPHAPSTPESQDFTNDDAVDESITDTTVQDQSADESIFASFVLTAYAANSDEDTSLSPNYMEETQKQILKPNTQVLLAQYSPMMSSVPGFPFTFELEYDEESADEMQIRLSADCGILLEWDRNTGAIVVFDTPVEIQSGTTLYWSPLSGSDSISSNASITVEAIVDGEVAARQILYITEDTDDYYYATVGDVEYP